MMGRAAGCRRRKRLIGERQMIELIDVTKRFGGKQILNHVHWRLPSPGVTVLTGASGAGRPPEADWMNPFFYGSSVTYELSEN